MELLPALLLSTVALFIHHTSCPPYNHLRLIASHLPYALDLTARSRLASRLACSALIASMTASFAAQSASGFILKLGKESCPERFTATIGCSYWVLICKMVLRRFLALSAAPAPSPSPARVTATSTSTKQPCFRSSSNPASMMLRFWFGRKRCWTFAQVTTSKRWATAANTNVAAASMDEAGTSPTSFVAAGSPPLPALLHLRMTLPNVTHCLLIIPEHKAPTTWLPSSERS